MKIRIKFEKDGVMRYIGHLDIMRYFQKAIRRAEIDIKYSTGFSPHQIMSFAAPLGVGHISYGEYFDIEMNSHNGKQDMMERLNAAMVPGIRITNVVELPDNAGNAMATVAAARYKVELKKPDEMKVDFIELADAFLGQDVILVTKQTKKQELAIDIKPYIFEWIPYEKGIEMFVDASSSNNVKPTLAMESFCKFIGQDFDPIKFQIIRMDTYLNVGSEDKKDFKPLDYVGTDF
jgi:radical SAM-linked protein